MRQQRLLGGAADRRPTVSLSEQTAGAQDWWSTASANVCHVALVLVPMPTCSAPREMRRLQNASDRRQVRTSPSTGRMTGAVVWVTPLDDSTFAKTSPFAIADEIRRITGEVEAAKPTHTGSLKVKFATAEQATSFALTEAFMGILVTCTTSQQDMVEAVAFVESLATLPEKTILKELKSQGAIGVLRLHPKNGKTSTGLRFRFSGTKHLASITAGFQKIPLRTWQSSPMLCRTCAEHGHTAKTCRSGTARCLRCAGPHATDACKSTEKRCPHCGGPHAAWERSCPTMKSLFKHGKTPQGKKMVGT